MTQKITPALWFNYNLDEALEFYTSIFKDSEVLSTSRYGEGGPGPAGALWTATFRLIGQEFMGINAGPMFSFTEAVSFAIDCADQAEVDYYWDRLTDGGEPSQCGWLKDRFGLSWQVVPSSLGRLLQDEDPMKAQRVMETMLEMQKIDIAELERASAGAHTSPATAD
jgi:predicted 3-demethylubiquinone-9 3-methyltransferase (glyoxalase superfamily)